MKTKMTFEQLTEALMPIVLADCPDTISVGKAKEIAEDCAYLIKRGKTAGMLAATERAANS